MIFTLALAAATLAGQWRIFEKMGRAGWEGIIPIYNIYVLFGILYGNGLRVLLLLIPILNIYIVFKGNIDLAHAFGKTTAFGVGLTLLSCVFMPLLGFSDAVFQGGYRR